MRRAIKTIYWLIIGLALGLSIPWLFVPSASGASASLGGGHLNPHSYSGAYSLEKGWNVLASLEDLHYENNKWSVNKGLLYFSSIHERHDNYGSHEKHTINSHTLALYAKPYWHLTERFKPFVMGGVGGNFASSFEPCVLVGAGVNYIFYENWSLEASFLKMWDHTRVYHVPTLSIRYEF